MRSEPNRLKTTDLCKCFHLFPWFLFLARLLKSKGTNVKERPEGSVQFLFLTCQKLAGQRLMLLSQLCKKDRAS